MRGRGMGSVGAHLLAEASALSDLTDAQKATIAKLEEGLKPEGPPGEMMKEMREARAELVAGVRAGKIDLSKLEARRAEGEKGMMSRHDKEAEALNGLHAALQPAQRKALVAAVKDHGLKDGGPRADDKKGDAARPADKKRDPAELAKRRTERLGKQLELDADQQKKVQAIVAKDLPDPAQVQLMRDEWKKKMEAFYTAFEGDAFDAKKLEFGPGAMKDKRGKAPMTREAAFLAELLPILKPEQREKLAASLEKPRPMMMRPGMGGPGMGGMGGPGMGFGVFDGADAPEPAPHTGGEHDGHAH